MVKMTFTLDDETVVKLKRAAARHKKPQSWVVREAVADYAAKNDMLSPEEKARMLAVLERFRQAPLTGTQVDVERAGVGRGPGGGVKGGGRGDGINRRWWWVVGRWWLVGRC